jgi:hypothetical protein
MIPQTYGDLKRLVRGSQRGEWPSLVNPSLTHSQALDVLLAGLETYPDDMPLGKTHRGFVYERNVLKETANG